MIISVVGSRPVNFKDNQTGNQITGTSYFYLCEDRYVTGLKADKVFVSSNLQSPFQVGKEYEVQYNQYGKFDFTTVRECVKS